MIRYDDTASLFAKLLFTSDIPLDAEQLCVATQKNRRDTVT